MPGLSHTKDPDERSDWTFDWGEERLAAGETISTATVVSVPALGITVETPILGTLTVTAFVSGGTLRKEYDLKCHVVTSAGRQFDWTHKITVVQA